MRGLFRIIWVGSKCSHMCLYEREAAGDLTCRGRPYDDLSKERARLEGGGRGGGQRKAGN